MRYINVAINKTCFFGILLLFTSCSKEDSKGSIQELKIIGNISITSQQQLDIFNYNVVTGTLSIGWVDGSNIRDLSGLSTLDSVGRIEVVNNPLLQSLDGLQNLSYVGELYIGGNDQLSDISSLSGIEKGLNNLFISNSNSLTNVDGIKMAVDDSEVRIQKSVIENLDGLSELNSVTKLSLFNLPNLNSVLGLRNLKRINTKLALSNLPSLTSLEGFNSLQSIPHKIKFQNLNIVNFQGFNGLISTQRLEIINCDSLLSLRGFNQLESVNGNFLIEDCDSLEDTGSFPNLLTIDGGLFLTNLPSLETLSGFSNLRELDGLYIDSCNSLTTLNGLNPTTHTSHGITLSNLNSLEDITALSNWTGSLYDNLNGIRFTNLPALTSLSGINFQEIHIVELSRLPNITSLEGMEAVTKINTLRIDNVSISNLTGFTNLTNVHETYIDFCYNLLNLNGTNLMEDIEVTNSNKSIIYIKNNSNLSDFCGYTQYASSIPFSNLYVSSVMNEYNPTKSQLRSQTECSQ